MSPLPLHQTRPLHQSTPLLHSTRPFHVSISPVHSTHPLYMSTLSATPLLHSTRPFHPSTSPFHTNICSWTRNCGFTVVVYLGTLTPKSPFWGLIFTTQSTPSESLRHLWWTYPSLLLYVCGDGPKSYFFIFRRGCCLSDLDTVHVQTSSRSLIITPGPYGGKLSSFRFGRDLFGRGIQAPSECSLRFGYYFYSEVNWKSSIHSWVRGYSPTFVCSPSLARTRTPGRSFVFTPILLLSVSFIVLSWT